MSKHETQQGAASEDTSPQAMAPAPEASAAGKHPHVATRPQPGQRKPRRKKTSTLWLAVAGLATVAVIGAMFGFAQFSPPVDYQDPRMIAQGEGVYAKDCQACHGDQGKGENIFHIQGGQKSNGDFWAPALNGTAHAWHHPPDVLFNVIKFGSPVKESKMRGWEGRLTDQEIHAVLAYIKSLWPPELRSQYDQAHNSR